MTERLKERKSTQKESLRRLFLWTLRIQIYPPHNTAAKGKSNQKIYMIINKRVSFYK